MTGAAALATLVSTERQRRAADPGLSAWVSASAGTGKTRVLTDRVLRLLMAPTPTGDIAPSRLLCLTFTTAAAAEMANRLAARLARWATEAEPELAAELTELLGAAPNATEIGRARRLFARVLDEPGGLAIVTLHGFCQSLLRRFPLEARVAPHFQVMEERDAAELMDEAREAVLAAAALDLLLRPALARVAAATGADGFAGLVADLARERGRLEGLAARFGGAAGVVAELRRRLGLAGAETAAGLLAASCAEDAFDAPALRRAARALEAGGVTDLERARRMLAFLERPDQRPARFDEWRRAFFTAEGTPIQRLATKAVEETAPDIVATLAAEQARLIGVIARRRLLEVAEATEALLTLGYAVLADYDARKRHRARLDYDDLVLAARRLLESDGGAAWALYKLDGGIDHVLIDEAQDTNPDQWAVVRALTAEFFAGRGRADEGTRTLFAVGDRKQSIFGFQRADPVAFDATERELAGLAERWASVELITSFRSARPVLAAVDLVFNSAEGRPGVVAPGERLVHEAARQGMAGRVELWPPIEPRPPARVEPWTPPVEQLGSDSPPRRMARLLAARIARMIGSEELPARGRKVRAGDVLVLVRRRGDFVGHLVRELKAARVPVAGADRMVLANQLAVMDLMALGRVLLLPEDDLTLAAVLKGPLVGLSEEDLLDLAARRGEARLWAALQGRSEPRYAAARDYLSGLMAAADLRPPYDLFAAILGDGGKARLLARLGAEAEDPIDEFLALALAYERLHAPSLQGFLHWLESGGDEIKRDFEAAGDLVRIMTVHGAKGLQAPVVFLPDTCQAPADLPSLLWLGERGDELPVWLPRAGDASGALLAGLAATAEAARDDEYRRLLYVAMTRAEDVLIVAGWKTRRPAPAHCWYFLVQAALADAARTEVDPLLAAAGETAGAEIKVLSSPQTAPPDQTAAAAAAPVAAPPPEWVRRAAPAEASPGRPLAPSRSDEDEPPVVSPLAGARDHRFQRGLLIHRLLQTLPELPPAGRRAAAERFLARRGLDADAAAALAAEVLAVLRKPGFAALFGPGSRAEVPLTGLAGGRAIAGQVDRLVVTGAAVLVVDYKSNRPPPRRVADLPAIYLRQMAAYRVLLAGIYPGRAVRCALLWTDGPRLMELPPDLLDRAAAALAPA